MGSGQSTTGSYRSIPSSSTGGGFRMGLAEGGSSEEELYVADDETTDEEARLDTVRILDTTPKEEKWYAVAIQIFFPFIVAGLGMVAAGLVLDHVQHWTVFIEIPEIFILIPALLGLKGNLEMTLASRLSTAANLNKMDTREDALALVVGNISLVQCQGVVVGFLAALTGVAMGWTTTGSVRGEHVLLLSASSVVTASLASFVLGLVMVAVILGSRRFKINPDNVSTPIAASLGDLTTLALLAWIASLLWDDLFKDKWLAPLIIVFYLLMIPASAWVAYRYPETRPVLKSGWMPVLVAMLISSGGGLILDIAVVKFHGIAVFQPVMNGVGGNLVAVQASRMTTQLHINSKGNGPGTLRDGDKVCVSPCAIIFGEGSNSMTASILLTLVLPGHTLFVYLISYLEAGHTTPTPTFLVFYLLAAWLQVAVLLYVCRVMVYWMWGRGMDPDNSAIPYLTALGDLLGGAFLGLAFQSLEWVGVPEFSVQQTGFNQTMSLDEVSATSVL